MILDVYATMFGYSCYAVRSPASNLVRCRTSMVTAITPPALLLAASTTDQLVRSLFDDTFNGVHHMEFFDWALLVPYFAILLVLSFYGCHRFEIIRKYLKHRRDLAPEPIEPWAKLPRVTIQLPLYNERYVVERLLQEACQMEYPRELLQIQVLDDSTDETHPFTAALVCEYQAAGLPIEYLHRDNRAGYK